MNHQPYEDWLLNDEPINPEKENEFRAHLRICQDCAALARTNLSLRSAVSLSPTDGFTKRFEIRLAAQRKIQFRRAIIGLFLLATVGLALILWLLIPIFPYFFLSPARLMGIWVSNLVYVGLTFRVLGVLGNSILNILVSLIPAYIWLLAVILTSGLVSLWTITYRKVGNYGLSVL